MVQTYDEKTIVTFDSLRAGDTFLKDGYAHIKACRGGAFDCALKLPMGEIVAIDGNTKVRRVRIDFEPVRPCA